MARLGICPTCGASLSTRAAVCPHCGESNFIDTYVEELPVTQCESCQGRGKMDVAELLTDAGADAIFPGCQVECQRCRGSGFVEHGRRILIDRRTNESRQQSRW